MSIEISFTNLGIRSPLLSFSQEYSQKDLPSWEAVTINKDLGLYSLTNTLFLEPVKIYRDGDLLETGLISSVPVPTIFDGFKSTMKLLGYNQLGYLWAECSANVHFQDVLVSDCLTTLLAFSTTTFWQLGDISTLDDISLTIDPRSEKTLWGQIQKVVQESGRPTYVRYGGESGGFHLLDVGVFDFENPNLYAIHQRNILKAPKFQITVKEPLKEIIPVSGSSSNEPVDVTLALNLEPSLATDPNYPLVGTSVINNTIASGKGVCRRISYPIHKTENSTEATEEQQEQVALSIVRKAQRDLAQSNPRIDLDIDVFLSSPPIIHDKCWVDINEIEGDYDAYTGERILIQSFNYQDWAKIVGWSSDYKERYTDYDAYVGMIESQELYSLSLSSGQDEISDNLYEIIYNENKDYGTNDNALSGIGLIAFTDVVVNEFNQASDCTTLALIDGKEFVFSIPSLDPTTTSIQTKLISISANYSFEITQQASFPANDLILCVFRQDLANWTIADDCTVIIRFLEF